MDKKNFMYGAVIAIAGAGAVYYFMSSKDDTPVGLVVRKSLNKGQEMGEDDLGDMYRYAIVDGSFRLTESSLSLSIRSCIHLLLNLKGKDFLMECLLTMMDIYGLLNGVGVKFLNGIPNLV